MKALRLLLPFVVAALPSPAAATIRAVFVGIDTYKYSRPAVRDAVFKNLSGAVRDARAIKKTLGTQYKIEFDADGNAGSPCRTANGQSITLINECATKASILSAWNEEIAASQPGDTLILYYAGHGSQLSDQTSTQASGYSDTILPHDARKPVSGDEDANADLGDIVDREIKTVIDRATARGVNVVTIFDSCNSGTATRDPERADEVRAVPPLVVRNQPRQARPAPAVTDARGIRGFGLGSQPLNQATGYRVHFAAAADGESAREVRTGTVGERAGVFTTAFAKAIEAMPYAPFSDIAAEVQTRITEGLQNGQHPQAEGALTASMGGSEQRSRPFAIAAEGGKLWLQSGEVSGVTAGSRFAIYSDAASAFGSDPKPVATATVGTVEPYRAALTLVGAPPPVTAKTLALETRHAFGEQVLLVRNGAAPADSARFAAILADTPGVRVAEPAAVALVADAGVYKLTRADGSTIASLGQPSSAKFEGDLRQSLEAIARVQALLALRTGGKNRLCLSENLDAEVYACDLDAQKAALQLKSGKEVKLIAANTASVPRYLYVYAIDENYQVTLALPTGKGIDPKVEPDMRVTAAGWPDTKGRITFLTLSTTQPLNAAVLEQSGVAARDPAACSASALARVLCAAQRGSRDPAAASVGDWDASIIVANVR